MDSSRCYIHMFGAAMAIAMAIDPIDIFSSSLAVVPWRGTL